MDEFVRVFAKFCKETVVDGEKIEEWRRVREMREEWRAGVEVINYKY